MRGRQRPEPELDFDAHLAERAPNATRPLEARRREGDDLVLSAGRLGEPYERATDVVADPERRMAQRTHVEHDLHRFAPGWQRKRLKWALSTRPWALCPGVTRA